MPQPGDQPVPGYRLVAPLGSGGMGEVWKAEGPGGTAVALKFVNLQRSRGYRELRSLHVIKQIHHPHLLPVTAIWVRDTEGRLVDHLPTAETTDSSIPAAAFDELIIAMTLGGEDLSRRRLQRRQSEGERGLDRDDVLNCLEGACQAIDFLNQPVHDLGQGPVAIQHCDIKPQNIMITSGVAQVCDFGLASVLGDIRSTARFAGTLAYAAPELLTSGHPSATTDQYSLAVTYYELVTGSLPYTSESRWEVEQSVLSGKLDLTLLPPRDRQIIARATSFQPERRYKSCRELIDNLRMPETSDLSSPKQSRRSVAPLLTVSVVLLLAAVVATLLMAPRPSSGAAKDWQIALDQQKIGVSLLGKVRRRFQETNDTPVKSVLVSSLGDINDALAALRGGPRSLANQREVAQALALQGKMSLQLASFASEPPERERLVAQGWDALRQADLESPTTDAAYWLTRQPADYATALQICDQALVKVDGGRASGELRFLRGYALLHLDKPSEAVDEFTSAIEGAGESTLTGREHFHRGQAHLAAGNAAAAASDFTRAMARLRRKTSARMDVIAPVVDVPLTYFLRGKAMLSANWIETSLRDFQQAARRDEARFGKRHEFSLALSKRGRRRRLAAATLLRLPRSSYVCPVTSQLSQEAAAISTRLTQQAIADFSAAIEHLPSEFGPASLLLERSHAYIATGRFAVALDDLQQALRAPSIAEEQQSDMQRAIAEANFFWAENDESLAQEKLNAALTAFTDLEDNGRARAVDLMNLGSVYRQLGQFEEAIKRFTLAAEMSQASQGNPAEALAWRAEAHEAAGDYDEALTDFLSALEQYPAGGIARFDQWELHFHSAACLELLGRQEEASSHLSTVLKSFPLREDNVSDLAMYYAVKAQMAPEDVREEYQEVSKLLEQAAADRNDPSVNFALAVHSLFPPADEPVNLSRAAQFFGRYLLAN